MNPTIEMPPNLPGGCAGVSGFPQQSAPLLSLLNSTDVGRCQYLEGRGRKAESSPPKPSTAPIQ